ncbi:MAG: HAMP domain-containing histidine kinase [Treponema sp.]|nr:HAMP domain-containing histidine kinase [Treponema sp.]
MKDPPRTSSRIAALLVWLLLSALTVFIIMGMRDRARLIRDNDNERILSTLFAGLRDSGDPGSAVESSVLLEDRIAGIAVYGGDFRPLYRWGRVPPVFDTTMLENGGPGRFGRYTIPDRKGRSVKFVIHFGRMVPPARPGRRNRDRPERHGDLRPPGDRGGEHGTAGETSPSFFGPMAGGRYLYIDISHPAYWRTLTLTAVLFPLIEACLLALVWYVRRLYLRNREYRRRIGAQQNLVVLGTAAGTLAHEIKNPLHSIRIQTGILARTLPEDRGEELRIINQEVERLSALVYRVNDYLREPAGNRAPLNVSALLEACGLRLCGRNILDPPSIRDAVILADGERLRSVFENVIRNALEAGGDEDEIGASISRNAVRNTARKTGGRGAGHTVVIRVYDRGGGIDPEDLRRLFDPFFTRKSTGTGIGLSVSRRFVEAAGGAITIENREGGGTLVIMVFPAAEAAS